MLEIISVVIVLSIGGALGLIIRDMLPETRRQGLDDLIRRVRSRWS